MSKHDPYIRMACIEALKSNMTSKHGCVIRQRNKIIGMGHNKLIPKYGDFHSDVKNIRSVHAEMDALSNSDERRLQGAIIYVVRIKPSSTEETINEIDNIHLLTCNSEPCKNCSRILKKKFNSYNITLYYTTK
tara:strand:+ start:100 stop:498 length:399 start_codon:yes stop_codon:yes gene_type:complete